MSGQRPFNIIRHEQSFLLLVSAFPKKHLLQSSVAHLRLGVDAIFCSAEFT